MPRRDDIRSILIIGSGPIVIGQGCEFDYSGTQACKALRREGYRVVLVNSNPATIMTDPEFADATYVEPLTPGSILSVIDRERPDDSRQGPHSTGIPHQSAGRIRADQRRGGYQCQCHCPDLANEYLRIPGNATCHVVGISLLYNQRRVA